MVGLGVGLVVGLGLGLGLGLEEAVNLRPLPTMKPTLRIGLPTPSCPRPRGALPQPPVLP